MLYVALTALFLITLFLRERQIDRERRDAAKERQSLLNRIQAPEQAVFQDREVSSEPQYIPADDDKAWWEEQVRINGGS